MMNWKFLLENSYRCLLVCVRFASFTTKHTTPSSLKVFFISVFYSCESEGILRSAKLDI